MRHQSSEKRTALVTNVLSYAGPGSVAGLLANGFSVFGHDPSFGAHRSRAQWETAYPGAQALQDQEPEALVRAVVENRGVIDALVSNDVINVFVPFEEATSQDYESMIRQGMVWPFRIAQAALASMKERHCGSVIFITSAAGRDPMPRGPLYSAVRAGTTALAIALGRAYGEHNIQVNAIGPAWFDNPTYFPKGWDANAKRKARLDSDTSLRRLGTQEEMGHLIALIASGKALPMTAQYIDFSGNSRP